jgi:flagellar biosynthesis chaperone FliJ
MSCLVFVIGCGGKNASTSRAQKAIDNAVRQLEVFNRSRTVTFFSEDQLKLTSDDLVKLKDVPTGKALEAQQTIQTISDRQLDEFNQSIDQLKTLVDDENQTMSSRTRAILRTLLSSMLNYRSFWSVNELLMTDTKLLQPARNIHLLCIELERLKSQHALIQPAADLELINSSEKAIADLKAEKEKTSSALAKVNKGLDMLQTRLKSLIEQRDTLANKIATLGATLNTISAKDAVDLQKTINTLETKQFAVTVQIEKFKAGPMPLPEEIQLTVGESYAENTAGIAGFQRAKELLEVQTKQIESSISSQSDYLEILKKQMKISEDKSAQLTGQQERLTLQLKNSLSELGVSFTVRQKIQSAADADIQLSLRQSQLADSDLKKYLGAIRDAESQNTSGQENPFLKQAKDIEILGYSIACDQADAQITRCSVIHAKIKFLEAFLPLLKRSEVWTVFQENMSAMMQDGPKQIESLKTELTTISTSTLNQYQSAYKSSQQGNFKSVVGTRLAWILYKVSLFQPDKAKEYQSEAKKLLNEISPASAGGNVQPDRMTLASKELQQLLETK